jgi:hypothetical protein
MRTFVLMLGFVSEQSTSKDSKPQQQRWRQQGIDDVYRRGALIGGLGWAAVTKKVPNDASGVVCQWAMGTFLFILFVFFDSG